MSAAGRRRRDAPWLRLQVAWRALFLQAFFNFERRQGIGFAAVVAPVAARFEDAGARREFLRRHLEDFNTNPAFAGPILGAVVRYELLAAAGEDGAADRALKLKRGLQAPFAAAGDALVWRGLRSGGGLWASALVQPAAFWAPVLFLILFNLGHLGFRLGGVFGGYARADRVHRLLKAPALTRALALIPAFMTGALLALTVAIVAPMAHAPRGPLLLFGAGLILGASWKGVGRGHGTWAALGAMMVGLLTALAVS